MNFFEFGWHWPLFGWACIGAAAVEFRKLLALDPKKIDFSFRIVGFYIGVSVGIMLFSAVITAGAFDPPDVIAALYGGVSCPIILGAGANTGPKP